MRKSRRQDGGGFFGDTLFKLLNPTGLTQDPPEFPGEKHAKSFRYLGPGSQLEMREKAGAPYNVPINALDAAAKKHDYAYKDAKTLQDVHTADETFLEDLKAIPDFSMTKYLAAKAIMLKRFAEKNGLLDPAEFSMSGTGKHPMTLKGELLISPYQDPALRLKRQMAKKGKKGGYDMGLIPFLAVLMQHSKIQSNLREYDNEDMKTLIARIGKMKPDKQIELICSACR